MLSSKDLINQEVDHIGVMAHAAWHEASTRSKIDIIEEEPEPETEKHVTVVNLSEPADPAVTVNLKADWRIDHKMTFEVSACLFIHSVICCCVQSLIHSHSLSCPHGQ